MNRNANQEPNSFRFMRKDFHQEDGHSSDLDQKRSGIPLNSRPQGGCDRIAELMMINFSESGQKINLTPLEMAQYAGTYFTNIGFDSIEDFNLENSIFAKPTKDDPWRKNLHRSARDQ